MTSIRGLLAVGAAALALATTASGQPTPSGEALFASGDFAGAGRAFEAEVKASPKDAAALAGLARIRLYQRREGEAAALAARALAIDPANSVAQDTQRQAQLRKAAFAPDIFRVSGLGAEVVLPFVSTDPLPVVQVGLQGGRQAYFLIDSGAPNIVLDEDLAKEMGLELTQGPVGVFAGGRQAQVQRTRVPELQLGSATIRDVPAAVMHTRRMAPFSAHPIDGIVGTGLFMHFLSTLDYCGGRLVLRPSDASADFEREAARTGGNAVPMWLVSDHLVYARARLEHGHEGLFSIDTGLAGGGLQATKAVLDDAGVTIDPSRKGVGMGGGGPVTIIPFSATATLGALTVADVRGLYSPDGNQFDAFPFKVSGTLSHMFFRKSRLTFDFRAMKLVTQAC
jgi:hypothetical protein